LEELLDAVFVIPADLADFAPALFGTARPLEALLADIWLP